MGFAKWFGGRTSKTLIAPAVPLSIAAGESKPRPSIVASNVKSLGGTASAAKGARGIDPYNSGAFKRGAWERVSRR